MIRADLATNAMTRGFPCSSSVSIRVSLRSMFDVPYSFQVLSYAFLGADSAKLS
jgi:hypothetical protein